MLDTDVSCIVTMLSREDDPRTEFELAREGLKRYSNLDTSQTIINIGSYKIVFGNDSLVKIVLRSITSCDSQLIYMNLPLRDCSLCGSNIGITCWRWHRSVTATHLKLKSSPKEN